jgi:tRNA 2-thiouridine synthesizing protein B
MLHTMNKSPYERNTFDTCLEHVKKGSALLLIEDGVYAAMKGTAPAKKLEQMMKTIPVYVLQPDVEARGMQSRVLDGVKMVDYSGFVDLAAEYPTVQSWL